MTGSASPDALDALRKSLAMAANDPGNVIGADGSKVGYKGDRCMGGWIADAILAGPLAPLLAAHQQVTAERDEARDELARLRVDVEAVLDEMEPQVPGGDRLLPPGSLAERVRDIAHEAVDGRTGEAGLLKAVNALRAEGEAKDRRIAELSETWTDEAGTVWSPPTAWAYAKTCAALEKRRAEGDEARSHLPEGLRDTSLAAAVRSLGLAASSENESKWRWGHALQIGIAFADKAAGEEWEHDGMASVDACYAMAAILQCECGGTAWNEMVRAGAARFAEHVEAARAATAREGA